MAEIASVNARSGKSKPRDKAELIACADLLKHVSRSFYLTLRVLPSSVRPQIGLAYLLARTSDTIADTELISAEQRVDALQALRLRIAGQPARLNFGSLASGQHSPSEKILLEQCEASVTLLEGLEPADRDRIRAVLETIISGQELDLTRFAHCSEKNIGVLGKNSDLDDYTYRVAGCVGEFWTRICRAHVFPNARLEDKVLLEQSVRFGKGLQLVNILRDIAADLRLGRCYLPLEKLTEVGLTPDTLLDPRNESKLRPVYNQYLELACEHLIAGWAYTTALPWKNARVRLACAWPILIGLETVKLLRKNKVLEPAQRPKINRKAVKKWIWRSVFYYPVPSLWRALAQP